MLIKEYAFEDGMPVDISKLRSPYMPEEDYSKAHAGTVIFCHDVYIKRYIKRDDDGDSGILLVKRKIKPATNILWPLGGRITRGFEEKESFRG